MESYKIYYNDGVYAETFTFMEQATKEQKQKYFDKTIKEYNKNANKEWHITMKNFVKVD